MGGLFPTLFLCCCSVTVILLADSTEAATNKIEGRPLLLNVDRPTITLKCTAPVQKNYFNVDWMYKGAKLGSTKWLELATWNVASQKLKTNTTFEIQHTVEDGVSTLVLEGVTSCQEGSYLCDIAYFEGLGTRAQYEQVVDTVPDGNKIQVTPKQPVSLRTKDDKAVLSCVVPRAEPMPTVHWMHQQGSNAPTEISTRFNLTLTSQHYEPYVYLLPTETELIPDACVYRVEERLVVRYNPNKRGNDTYFCEVRSKLFENPHRVPQEVIVMHPLTGGGAQAAVMSCIGQPVCIGPIVGALIFIILVVVIVSVCLCKRRKNRTRSSNDNGTKHKDEEMHTFVVNGRDTPPPPEYSDDADHRLDCTTNTTLHSEYGGCHSDFDEEEEEDVKPKQKHLNVLL